MNFKFSLSQKMIHKMFKEFAEKEIAPVDAHMDKSNEFPHKLFEKIIANNLLGLVIPREYGGAGADTVTGALAMIEIAQASPSVAVTFDGHWLGADNILHFGTEEQKKKFLPRAAAGELIAFSLTEPGAGSDASEIRTTAELNGDEYVLNGTKAWCTNGGVAGMYIVLAKTDKTKGVKGITAFIVEASNPGLSIGKKEDKMGMRGSQTTELFLNDCRIKKDARLGAEGEGFKIAMFGLDGARINIAAIAAGICENVLRKVKRYAKERYAFGSPIVNFQAVLFKIANMATTLHAIKLMTFDTAAMKDAGQPHTKESAIIKLFSSTNTVQICLDAIQIMGGNGYSRENHVERLLRDSKFLEIGDGTTEIMKMLIGRIEMAE